MQKIGIKTTCKPIPMLYISGCLSGRTRLFDENGIIYCSIDSEEMNAVTVMPPHWKEIKKSDFYKIIEECEQ